MIINIDEIEINLIDEIEDVKKIIKTLDKLDKTRSKYLSYANVFELSEYKDEIEHINNGVEIEYFKDEFINHLQKLRNYLENIYNYDVSKNKDISKIQKILKNYTSYKNNASIRTNTIMNLKQIINESFLEEEYIQCLNNVFTKELDYKVKDIIAQDKLLNLEKEKQTIQNVKVNFFGKFTGKKKLKELALENIDLKKEHVLSEVNSYSSYCSVDDIINTISSYIENKNTSNINIKQLNEILDSINNINLKKVITTNSKQQALVNKPRVYTLVKYNDTSISTKEKIQYFENSNIELKKDATKSRMKSITEQTKDSISDQNKQINRFFACISDM